MKSRIAQYYGMIRQLSGRMIVLQAIFSIRREIRHWYLKIRDYCFSTQINKTRRMKLTPLSFEWERLDCSQFPEKVTKELARMYLEHRFDLLGSGWIKNGFYNNASGFEKYRYEALEITDFNEGWLKSILLERDIARGRQMGRLISPDYIPIDWQKDSKTGYRWDARKWYQPVELAKLPGADIKIPWELSRLEHLPRMAIFAYTNPRMREQIKQEFVDECMDFMRQNPVRRGVNWMCTMDVGIRTANIVLAYSLFRAIDRVVFPEDFEYMLTEMITVHCRHIYHNLEWSALIRSNHYLANICGLIYGASVLPRGYQQKRWLTFARREYETELLSQFYEEGSNFEGSIGYHRLSGEMAVFTGALIEYLSGSSVCRSLSQDEWNRIGAIGQFSIDTMNPEKCFVQMGDNDSGRFFTLSLIGNMEKTDEIIRKYKSLENYQDNQDMWYWDEQVNSPEQLISAAAAFKKERNRYVTCLFEYSLINSMLPEKNIENKAKKTEHNQARRNFVKNPTRESEILMHQTQWYVDNNGCCHDMEDAWKGKDDYDLTEGLEHIGYPQFGIYIYRSNHLYLCINATDNGQNGYGGHSHNDKLSFELWIGRKAVFQDPGAYVYTSLISERNKYRSTKAHNCIQSGVEQNRFVNTFAMSNDTRCELLELSKQKIVLQVNFGAVKQRRSIRIDRNRIHILDESNRPICKNSEVVAVTSGYGKLKYCEDKER